MLGHFLARNVVTCTPGECDLDSSVSHGTSENTLMLLPKGTIYLGTAKHYSVVKVQHVGYIIAQQGRAEAR